MYQLYQKDQDQIRDATYLSDVVFLVQCIAIAEGFAILLWNDSNILGQVCILKLSFNASADTNWYSNAETDKKSGFLDGVSIDFR